MDPESWKDLAGQEVTISAGRIFTARLGRLLGFGAAGAVYELEGAENTSTVVKVLAADSPIARQELESLQKFRARVRFSPGLMKFTHSQGTLTCGNGQHYPCYFMRKGKTLLEAIRDKDKYLNNPQNVQDLAADLAAGLISLHRMGLSHGDIKPANILLVEYKGKQYPMFSDYGTVSGKELSIKTVDYTCNPEEYEGEHEKLIAYDLHCLYLALRSIYGIDDDDLAAIQEARIRQILRLMRDSGTRAYQRLELLNRYAHSKTSADFYLDAVPFHELTADFPFDKVMPWGDNFILRDWNALPDDFDPMLLLKIPPGRYAEVYKFLNSVHRFSDFVMPVCRYYDGTGEYVLIHAPDDKRKVSLRRPIPRDVFPDGRIIATFAHDDVRLLDPSGIPFTLESAPPPTRNVILAFFVRMLNDARPRVPPKYEVCFSAKDIWSMNRRWCLNLFTVDLLEKADENADTCCISWRNSAADAPAKIKWPFPPYAASPSFWAPPNRKIPRSPGRRPTLPSIWPLTT